MKRKRTTLKNLRGKVRYNTAQDITSLSHVDIEKIRKTAGGFDVLEISSGVNGVNGCLLKGRVNGAYYVVISRTSALLQVI